MPVSRFDSETSVARTLRFEHKYLVPESLLSPLRRLVTAFARPDSHASPHGDASSPSYVVRTLYLDTSRLTHYYEAEDGLSVRAKPRIRGYGDAHPNADVFLEIKRRCGAVGSKERAMVAWDTLGTLLAAGDVEHLVRADVTSPHAIESARRFLFHLRRDALRLVLLVVYDREAYIGNFEPSLRVTFDKQVRSTARPTLGQLFDEYGARRSLVGRFVLEVKYDAGYGFPSWLRPFIADHGLVRQALSKYWTCATDQGLARSAALRFAAIA